MGTHHSDGYNSDRTLTTVIGTTQMGFKVVPISPTSTVNERLALPIGTIMEEPQEESLTWTGLRWEGADVRFFGNNMTRQCYYYIAHTNKGVVGK